ncbi:MAG: hypothetical protein JXR63_03125 [Spirochaetales bacterium]|nr:hypothetical protein [Spirochaetales bacterium]
MKRKKSFTILGIFVFSLFSLTLNNCKEQSLLDPNIAYTHDSIAQKIESQEFLPIDIEEGVDSDLFVGELIPVPLKLEVSKGDSTYLIELSWTRVKYGSEDVAYHVYRAVEGSSAIRITGDSPVTDSRYEENLLLGEIESGVSYRYMVRAVVPRIVDEEGLVYASKISNAEVGFVFDKVRTLRATQREFVDRVELSWDPVPSAEYYTVYRATADENGNPPKYEQSYKLISNALATPEFLDYSTEKQGSLSSQYEYFYIVKAHKGETVVSLPSSEIKGSILAFGAPSRVDIAEVTSGVISNGIRILWKSNGADEYVINRISKEAYASGDIFGESLLVKEEFLGTVILEIEGKSEEFLYYYDDSEVLKSGDNFYYRVAGKNSLGVGKFTDFSNPSSVQGSAVADYAGVDISVAIKKDGFHISWPRCNGSNSYLIYRSESNPDYGSADWVFVGQTANLSWHDEVSNLPSGFVLESGELFYQVLPINSDFVSVDAGSGAIDVNTDYLVYGGLTIADLAAEIAAISDFSSDFGLAEMSDFASDYTVPVPVFDVVPVASDDDSSCEGRIRLTGKISNVAGLQKLSVKVVRRSFYGYETGVHSMMEPRKGIGGVAFSKKGEPFVESVQVFDLKPYLDLNSGSFEFLDPMYATLDGQLIPDSDQPDGYRKHVWNYAAWDNEAWKYIKRQLPFDMNKSVKVSYEFRIERQSDATWGAVASSDTGYPALTDKEMAHLILWLKDVAMNRISLILIPRYGWDKTVAWLPGSNQRLAGEYNRHIGESSSAWFWAKMQGLGAYGEGGVEWGYSDWPGFKGGAVDFNKSPKNISLSVELTSGIRNIETYYGSETPLYEGYIYYNINVDSYNYHWGLGNDQGTFDVWHKGRKVSFPPAEIIPRGNDPKGLVFGRTEFDSGSDRFPNSDWFGDNCIFTRINFKYRPYPVNEDFIKERYPVMYYGYSY